MGGGTSQTRELRIAPVMTGGTSLAVWMGGVTAELYSMARTAHEDEAADSAASAIYRSLLDLTGTTPVIDVVTGTSAGGLNGSLLATAVCLRMSRRDFGSLFDVWMTMADLEQLLRRPDERDAPSLLRGDEYFRQRLTDVIRGWQAIRNDERPDEQFAPIDLVTTYTMVHPVQRHLRDDFGEELNEVVYAGTLRFTDDDFHAKDIAERLAIASRTSASIPGVFEPSFLTSREPSATGDDDKGVPNLWSHQPQQLRGVSRWAVDGGVVVNLPLGEALDRIFERKAKTRVRRVILYVCPTPSGRADATDDRGDAMPTIRESALTAISAPLAEGIAGDLETIRRHNRVVERQRSLRRTMSSFIDVLAGELERPTYPGAPRSLFDVYRDRRTDASISFVVDRLIERGGTIPDERAFRASLRLARWNLLPTSIDELGGGSRSWGWGIAPLEEAGSTILGLVSRAVELSVRRPSVVQSPHEQEQQQEAVARSEALNAVRAEVHQQLAIVQRIRALDERYWRKVADAPQLDPDPYERWPLPRGEATLPGATGWKTAAQVFEALLAVHRALAQLLVEASPDIREAALRAGAMPPTTSPGDGEVSGGPDGSSGAASAPTSSARAQEAQAVFDELRTLVPDDEVATRVDVADALELSADGAAQQRRQLLTELLQPLVPRVQRQLLVSHVVATLLLDDVMSREQPSEFMQVSWNSPNHLDPGRRVDDKLVGPELSRLGAFLKPSWRANDWFWGRMDGAARLVRLLLEPVRLYELGVTRKDVLDRFHLVPEDVGAELDFLLPARDTDDGRAAAEAAQLPRTCHAVAKQLQLAIAREELPRLAVAIDESIGIGANPPATAGLADEIRRAFATVPSDDEVRSLVVRNRIGAESATSELGSDLGIRLASRGLGVAVNAVTGERSGLGAMSKFLAPIRGPLQLVNAVIGVVTGRSVLARALTVFVLAISGAILGVRLSGVSVNGALVAAASLVFVGALVIGQWRTGVRLGLIGWLLAGLVVTAAVVGDDVSSLAYTGTAAVDPSTVGEGGAIAFGDDTVIRITRTVDGEELVEDVQLDASAAAVVTSGTVTSAAERTHELAGWKRWLFIEEWHGWSVAKTLAALGAIGVAIGTLRRSRRRNAQLAEQQQRRRDAQASRAVASGVLAASSVPITDVHQVASWRRGTSIRVAAALGLLVLAVSSHDVWDATLTGTRPAEDLWKSSVKGFLVWLSELLATWHLAVLLVVLIGAGTLLGIGADRVKRATLKAIRPRRTGA